MDARTRNSTALLFSLWSDSQRGSDVTALEGTKYMHARSKKGLCGVELLILSL